VDVRQGTEQLDGAYVTPNTFPFLAVPPLMGRLNDSGRCESGRAARVRDELQAVDPPIPPGPLILGRHVVFPNRQAGDAGGIMPSASPSAERMCGWRRRSIARRTSSGGSSSQAETGFSLKQAEADLLPIAQRWAKRPSEGLSEAVQHGGHQLRGEHRGPVQENSADAGRRGGAAAVDRMANVANMLLARATARDKEMAVRARGGEPVAVVRQLLVESMMLAIGGAVLAAALHGQERARWWPTFRRRDSRARPRSAGWTVLVFSHAAGGGPPRWCSGWFRRCRWRGAISWCL